MTDDHDELPLTDLIKERMQRNLEPLLSALLKLAETHRNILGPDHLEELVRLGIELGIARADADRHLRQWMQENQIQLKAAAPIPVAALAPAATVQPVGNNGKGTSSPALPPQPQWCPQCCKPALPQDRYCGTCGLSLRCMRCGKGYQSSSRFCASCGLDPLKFRQFQEQLDGARRLLAGAQGKTATADRLSLAEQALKTIAEALQRFSDDAQGLLLRTAAQKLVIASLWQACAVAQQADRLGEALRWLGRLQQEPFEAARAGTRIQEITAIRKQSLAAAQKEISAGKWKSALQMLATARQQFPDDAEINTAMSGCQEKCDLISKALRDSIPRLDNAQRIVELLMVLRDLDKNQLHFEGLKGKIESCEKMLRWAEEANRNAQRSFDEGRHNEALSQAEKILSKISDFTPAQQLKEQIQKWYQLRDDGARQLEEAIASQRWFRAQIALCQLDRLGLGGAIPQEKVAAVERGVSRANDYRRLLVWSFLGACFLFVSVHLARALQGEVARRLPESLFGLKILSAEVLTFVVHATSLALFSFFLLAFLLACMRRPLSPSALWGWTIAIVLGPGMNSLLLSVAAEFWAVEVPPVAAWLIHGANALLITAWFGGMLGYLSVALVNRVLPPVAGWWTSLHWQAIWMGLAGTWLCMIGSSAQGLLLDQIPVAVFFGGLLGLVGIVSHRSFYALFLAAIFANGLITVIARSFGTPTVWQMGTIIGATLAATAFFVAPQRQGIHTLAWSIVFAGFSFVVCQFLLTDHAAVILLPVWVALCGVIAADTFNQSDYRLHLWDRCRFWWTRRKYPR